MKKMIALFLVLATLLSMVACSAHEEMVSGAAEQTEQTEATFNEMPEEETTVPGSIADESPVTEEAIPTEETNVTESAIEATTAAETIASTPTSDLAPDPAPKPAPSVPSTTPSTEAKPIGNNHSHDYSHKTEKFCTNCTEGGYIYCYCSCGDYRTLWQAPSEHTLATQKVITPATHEAEGLSEMYCLWCSYTTTEATPKLTFPYLVDVELVSATRAKPHYLQDGQELLTRLFGKNKVFQDGDSVVLKVVMSDGSTDFKVQGALGCDYTVDGNLVYVTFASLYQFYASEITISARAKDGTTAYRHVYFDVVHSDKNLGESNYAGLVLQEYGQRLGMKWITNGTDFVDLYNGGYTNKDESLSLTGCTIRGTDDRIVVAGNPGWIDEAIWLLDQYAAMGFTKFSFDCSPYSFTTLAE